MLCKTEIFAILDLMFKIDIIGIAGLSGSGKSTLSKKINKYFIDKKVSSSIIEMDCLLNELKEKYFSREIDYVSNDDAVYVNLKKNPITTVELNSNKTLIRCYFFFRNIIINFLTLKKIFKLKKEGYSLAIIEGVNLNCLILPINYRIIVTCDYDVRLLRKSLREKHKISKSSLDKMDYRHQLVSYGGKYKYDYLFDNSEDISSMENAVNEVYKNFCLKKNNKNN